MYEKRHVVAAAMIALVAGVFVGATFLPTTEVQIFNSATVAGLRYRRDVAEHIAADFKDNADAPNARVLYTNAMAANNHLISLMAIAMGEPQDQKSIKTIQWHKQKADDEWSVYYSSQFPKYAVSYGDTKSGTAQASESAIAVSILVELVKIREDRAREQRAAIRQQLNDCKWRAWNDI
jgi:hypothetical protein